MNDSPRMNVELAANRMLKNFIRLFLLIILVVVLIVVAFAVVKINSRHEAKINAEIYTSMASALTERSKPNQSMPDEPNWQQSQSQEEPEPNASPQSQLVPPPKGNAEIHTSMASALTEKSNPNQSVPDEPNSKQSQSQEEPEPNASPQSQLVPPPKGNSEIYASMVSALTEKSNSNQSMPDEPNSKQSQSQEPKPSLQSQLVPPPKQSIDFSSLRDSFQINLERTDDKNLQLTFESALAILKFHRSYREADSKSAFDINVDLSLVDQSKPNINWKMADNLLELESLLEEVQGYRKPNLSMDEKRVIDAIVEVLKFSVKHQRLRSGAMSITISLSTP